MPNTEDAFVAYAKQQEKEAAERAARQNNSTNGTPREVIQWTGLETNKMKVLRVVGGPPDSKVDNFTAKTIRIARINGDDGKQFVCIYPERADAPDHIIWKIMAKVNAIKWVDQKKVNIVEEQNPAIYNIINKNGLSSKDKRFTFERGWEGRHVLLMNVIDREQMDWHREHKHTMLLSRQIGENKEGAKFPEEGVPSYGFVGLLANLFKFYKSWERYDIGITRTGLKETPYRVINATKYLEEVPEELQQFVTSDPLTEEELSWEKYDLEKLYKFTSMTKIYNRMKGIVAKIDLALNTHFLEELTELVEVEKKLAAASNPPAEAAAEPAKATRSLPPAAPTVMASINSSLLLGWNKLSAAEKARIVSTTVKNGNVTEIIYEASDEAVLGCPSCGIAAPESFLTCPKCGIAYA